MTVPSFCRRCARPQVRERICRWCGTRQYDDMAEPQRQFYVMHQTWHAQERIDAEIFFGLSYPNNGTLGEMAMRWHRQGSSQDYHSKSVPRLEVFCDAWIILERFRDVVVALAERDSVKTKHNVTPAEFVTLLESLGFVDVTPRVPPKHLDSLPPVE